MKTIPYTIRITQETLDRLEKKAKEKSKFVKFKIRTRAMVQNVVTKYAEVKDEC